MIKTTKVIKTTIFWYLPLKYNEHVLAAIGKTLILVGFPIESNYFSNHMLWLFNQSEAKYPNGYFSKNFYA